MPKLLFVDACLRGEKSRTLKLCHAFIEEFQLTHAEWTVEHLDLAALNLPPFNAETLAERDAQVSAGVADKPGFDLAHQFAAADMIVVGAPYWDLSFPAILKIYIEHVSVCGITFHYKNDWLEGLCQAKTLFYVTTSGGPLDNLNFGYDYFRGLCQQFGIKNCDLITAESLDRDYSDAGSIMSTALKAAREKANKSL